jgi:hypothetical protein
VGNTKRRLQRDLLVFQCPCVLVKQPPLLINKGCLVCDALLLCVKRGELQFKGGHARAEVLEKRIWRISGIWSTNLQFIGGIALESLPVLFTLRLPLLFLLFLMLLLLLPCLFLLLWHFLFLLLFLIFSMRISIFYIFLFRFVSFLLCLLLSLFALMLLLLFFLILLLPLQCLQIVMRCRVFWQQGSVVAMLRFDVIVPVCCFRPGEYFWDMPDHLGLWPAAAAVVVVVAAAVMRLWSIIARVTGDGALAGWFVAVRACAAEDWLLLIRVWGWWLPAAKQAGRQVI